VIVVPIVALDGFALAETLSGVARALTVIVAATVPGPVSVSVYVPAFEYENVWPF
jgi:hypothetical protein